MLKSSGEVTVVPAESVAAGARVEVLAGDLFPTDSHIESGESAVDRGWLTGESQPEPVAPGSAVLAGTTNLTARVVVLSEHSGAATRAARITREVEQAALRRAPIARLADRVSAFFCWACWRSRYWRSCRGCRQGWAPRRIPRSRS